jgi:hypothetical protein
LNLQPTAEPCARGCARTQANLKEQIMYTTRFIAVCALLAAAIMLTGCAEQPQVAAQTGAVWTVDEAPLTAATAVSKENRTVHEKMRVRVRELDVTGLKFKDVIGYLRDTGNVNIVVNWGALQAAGIDAGTEVGEIKLANVTFEKAFTTVLETVSGGLIELQYVVDEGVITISTREHLEEEGRTVIRVYDVRDLIDGAGLAKWEKTLIRELIAEALRRPVPKSEAPVAVRGQYLALADAYRWRIAELAQAIDVELREERILGLLDVIRATIDRNSWEANSGTIATVRYFNGQLIIRHTFEAHRRIARLLSVLRRQAAPMGAERRRDADAPGATTRPAK